MKYCVNPVLISRDLTKVFIRLFPIFHRAWLVLDQPNAASPARDTNGCTCSLQVEKMAPGSVSELLCHPCTDNNAATTL